MHIFKIPAGITKMYLEVNGMKMHIDFAEAGTDKTVEVIWQDNNVAVRPGAGGMGCGGSTPRNMQYCQTRSGFKYTRELREFGKGGAYFIYRDESGNVIPNPESGAAVRSDKPFKDCVPIAVGRGDGYYTAGLSNGKFARWVEIEPVFGTEKEAIERARFVRDNS